MLLAMICTSKPTVILTGVDGWRPDDGVDEVFDVLRDAESPHVHGQSCLHSLAQVSNDG